MINPSELISSVFSNSGSSDIDYDELYSELHDDLYTGLYNALASQKSIFSIDSNTLTKHKNVAYYDVESNLITSKRHEGDGDGYITSEFVMPLYEEELRYINVVHSLPVTLGGSLTFSSTNSIDKNKSIQESYGYPVYIGRIQQDHRVYVKVGILKLVKVNDVLSLVFDPDDSTEKIGFSELVVSTNFIYGIGYIDTAYVYNGTFTPSAGSQVSIFNGGKILASYSDLEFKTLYPLVPEIEGTSCLATQVNAVNVCNFGWILPNASIVGGLQ